MRRNGLVRAGIVFAASLAFVTQATAFVRDTHYDLTYLISLSTCFNWEEAHLIANANFMVDRNKTTKAESGSVARQNKVACPIEGDAKGRMALPGATEDQLKALPEFRYAE